MVDANIDIIEIGFLDDRRPFDINRDIMPDTDSVEKDLRWTGQKTGNGSRNDRLWYL